MPPKSKSRKRNFSNYIKGRVDHSLAAGSLTTLNVVSSILGNTAEEATRIGGIRAGWSSSGFTPGEGPIYVGVAHSDYTAAEIEECLEVADSWNKGNKTDRERGKRLIRTIGAFPLVSAAETLNDGKPIYTKLNWRVESAQSLSVWIYNRTSGTLTTGGAVNILGHANLWLL